MTNRLPFETCDIAVDIDIVPPWAPVCDELVLEESNFISNSPDSKIPDVAVPPDCQCFPDIRMDGDSDFSSSLTVTISDVTSPSVSISTSIDELSTEDKDKCEHPCDPDPETLLELSFSAAITLPCIAFTPSSPVTISPPLTGSLTLEKKTGCKLELGGTLGANLDGYITVERTGPGITYVKCCDELNSNITLTASPVVGGGVKLTLCVDIKIPLLGLLDDEGAGCDASTTCPDPTPP